MGRTLEWWRSRQRTTLRAIGWGALLGAVVLTVKAGGFDWVGVWWLWLAMVAIPTIFMVPNTPVIAAAAQWLCHKGLGKGVWVQTYELTSVYLTRSWPDHRLELKQGNTTLSVRADSLQQNPRLWTLVYNGIAHSAMNGAAIVEDDHREETRKLLALPIPRQ